MPSSSETQKDNGARREERREGSRTGTREEIKLVNTDGKTNHYSNVERFTVPHLSPGCVSATVDVMFAPRGTLIHT